MSISFEVLLAGLVAQASVVSTEGTIETKVVGNLPTKERKVRVSKGKPLVGSTVEKQAAKPAVSSPEKLGPTIELPAMGTLDAGGFQLAMRRATDDDAKRKALAGFCGVNMGKPLGPQIDAADMKARRELRPIMVDPSEPFKAIIRPIAPSVQGFIAGMPRPEERLMAQIKALELVKAGEIADREFGRTRE